MNVRIASEQDKNEVLRLFNGFNAFMDREQDAHIKGSAIFDEIVSRDDTKIFVADDEGKLAGLVTFYLLPNICHGWKRGHIEDFFVSEEYRKKGVGSLLFTAVKDYCKQNGIKVIKLDSGNELTHAHVFYEKHGGKTSERFFRFDIE